jgi:hypothetical protein
MARILFKHSSYYSDTRGVTTVSYGAMDFTSLLDVSRSTERSFLFLIDGLLLVVPVIVAIPTIRRVDLPIFLLLLL